MSLIKEALDKAQKKTTGTSSEDVDFPEERWEPEARESPDGFPGDLMFYVWSGIVFLVSVIVGFELIYLLSIF